MRPFVVVSIVGSIFFSLFVALSGAQAQAVLKGRVTDEAGDGVPGAHVRVVDVEGGTATGPEGRYRVEDLPPGTHTVLVSSVGFQQVRREVAMEDGSEHQLDVTLTETVIVGDEVVVTGTMEETHVKDSPVKVEAVSPQHLDRGAATTNVMDVIGHIGGVNQQLNCGVCYTNDIRINGVEGANTAVLLDGMPVMGALASVYGLNGLSPSIIDQIEVIKGPQSTLYGTEALGGVVNIRTKDPARTPSYSAHAYVDETRETSLELAASPDAGRMKGFVSGSMLHMDRYIDDNGDGFSDIPRRTRLALFGKGSLSGPRGAKQLDVAAKYYTETRSGGLKSFSQDLRGSDQIYGEVADTRRSEVMVDYRPLFADQRFRLRGAFTVHDQVSDYGTEHYDAQQSIVYGQATWTEPVAETGRLLAGGTIRHQSYDDNTPATGDGADRRLIPGLFAQGEVDLRRSVTLLGGLRVDHHEQHGWIPAPRVSAKYSPSDRTTFRLNSGTGFRVVNVFTEDHAALTGSREVVFREALDPERSYSLTTGVQHILPLAANPLTIEVDGFYTRFTNRIIPDYDQDPNLIVYENLDGHSVTQGASVALRQNFTAFPITYDLTFTLMDVARVEDTGRRRVSYAPRFTGGLSTTYQLQDPELSVDYTLSLVGPKRMPAPYVEFGRSEESPTYATHDVRVTRTFSDANGPQGFGAEAYVGVDNLLDYTQGSPLIAAERPFSEEFDTVYTWGPLLGRTVSVGVRVDVR